MYFLGIDGGGTRTTCTVADSSGAVLTKTIGDSINYYSVGMEQARDNLRRALEPLYKQLGTDCFDCAVIGMSAIAGRATAEETAAFTSGILKAQLTVMDSDVYIALASLSTQGECAVVICGTGSMAAGRTAGGEIIHTGGWGYILGDEGSGYSIALDAIREAVRVLDGSGQQTALLNEVYAEYNASDMESIVDTFYNPPMPRSRIAAFTPRVFRCAQSTDEVALSVIKSNAYSIGKTVTALLNKLPCCKELGMWGGVFQHNAIYRDIFREYISLNHPDINVHLLDIPPDEGAVRAAINEYNKQKGLVK